MSPGGLGRTGSRLKPAAARIGRPTRPALRVHAIITLQLRLWRTAREASTRVSTRHARVRAPHLPVSQCEVILAAVLSFP
jgi:hypothetical protein